MTFSEINDYDVEINFNLSLIKLISLVPCEFKKMHRTLFETSEFIPYSKKKIRRNSISKVEYTVKYEFFVRTVFLPRSIYLKITILLYIIFNNTYFPHIYSNVNFKPSIT